MAEATYDLVVIGGGIHGVGVAQAAAAAGHSVLLLEQSGLAAATSSRSSKLIHGGLRYLESGQLSLVRECIQERSLLLRLAPDLVQMRDFYLPVYKATRRRPWQLRIGLSIYSCFGRLRAGARFRTVPRREWSDLDGLRIDGLQVIFCYADAQTDDAALTAAVMASAERLGAELAVPARFIGGSLTEQGCAVQYEQNGQERRCFASAVVNASGAWVGPVLSSIESGPAPIPVDLVQGTHIVVEGSLERGIYYVEHPRDRRAVFVMPWQGRTLVGTTETPFHGDPADVRPLPEEETYLSEVLFEHFPRYAIGGAGRIVESWAGLRVLPTGSGTAFGRSRETILQVDRRQRPRVISIYGGKLTAYRLTAERVMKRLAESLPARRRVAETGELGLGSDGGIV